MRTDPESVVGDPRIFQREAVIRSYRKRIAFAALHMTGTHRDEFIRRQEQRLEEAQRGLTATLLALADRRARDRARETEQQIEAEQQARQQTDD